MRCVARLGGLGWGGAVHCSRPAGPRAVAEVRPNSFGLQFELSGSALFRPCVVQRSRMGHSTSTQDAVTRQQRQTRQDGVGRGHIWGCLHGVPTNPSLSLCLSLCATCATPACFSPLQDYYELGVILTRKKLFTQATKNLEKAKKLWDGEESDLAQVRPSEGCAVA